MALIGDLWSSVPPITRTILLISIILTGAVSLDLCTPFKLYFNYNLIKHRYQFWRIFTCLFYYGEFSVDTIFDFFILYRYSIMLESESFRNKPADFILFFVFGSSCFILIAIIFGLEFLSPCISSMMLYLWCRRNPTFYLNFLEIFHFRAPFLPWVLILFVSMFGYNPIYDIVGVCVGHIYYFLEDVVPKIPETRDLRLLKAPSLMVKICDLLGIHGYVLNHEDFAFEDDQNGNGQVRDPDNIREDVLIDENNEDIRASYFDYESECQIRRKPDSMIRSLIRQYQIYRTTENSKLTTPTTSSLFFFASLIETMFYFPNRFGTIVTLNTHTVSYTTTENALLSLMSIMFKMQNQTDMEFKLRNVYGIYKLFLGSTLLYEAGQATMRLKLYELLENKLTYKDQQSSMLNGFLAGIVTQQALTPLYKLHIANHNYKISDNQSFRSFYSSARASNQNLFQFLFSNPLSILMRGGLSGVIQVTAFKKMLANMDDPVKTNNFQFKAQKTQNQKISEYMNRVQDDNEVLNKLISIGYYTQSDDGNLKRNISPYRNILISGFFVSALSVLILTPIDLLIMNQLQTRLYGLKSLQNIKLTQVYKEIRQTKGIHRILTMVTAAAFVRNFFFITSFYSAENYLKQQLIKE